MTIGEVAALSYGAGAALFGLLTVLLLTAWRGRLQGGLLVIAVAVTGVWCAAATGFVVLGLPPFSAVQLLEVARDTAWLVFLLRLLGFDLRGHGLYGRSLRLAGLVGLGLCVALAALIVTNRYAPEFGRPESYTADLAIFGHLLVAVLGLALVEQLYRNTPRDLRWGIKYLCFGVGGLFAYDLFLYSHALLFKTIDVNTWAARGAVNALVVPFIAVSARRNPDWSLDIFVSRHVVFHSAALVGTGAYLLLMAAAGYYIRLYGGTWGGVFQAVFLSGAVLLLVALLMSGQVRSRAKVFLSKHFFRNKYDYREEWLHFTHTLSRAGRDADVPTTLVKAIAEIVESPGGLLWVRQRHGRFECSGGWNLSPPEGGLPAEAGDSPLVRFLARDGWVVILDEHRDDPEAYDHIPLPEWLGRLRRPWMVVPLLHGRELVAFLVLARSPTMTSITWEDKDLLKTVGRQAASYLALALTNEALAEARQFDAFHRMSAYVVHDLKNVAAQLSLVVSNARRHLHSPGFVEDAIDTVENATARMNRMLAQLRKGRMDPGDARTVRIAPVLEAVAAARAATAPAPVLALEGAADGVEVVAEPDRLAAVLEHLVQNAQEATPPDGDVRLGLTLQEGWAVITVRDTGCGMDADFIAERLFRPFDTTKGNAGMGVGVYEAREFVYAAGGELEVSSAPREGTEFRIRLPLAASSQGRSESPPLEMAG